MVYFKLLHSAQCCMFPDDIWLAEAGPPKLAVWNAAHCVWQTHNWPSDHQPTFCTQVTEGTWAFNRSLLLILFISANISPESNTEKTYTHPHISSHLLKRTWYMQQKLLKTSFKSSWQPKVNKRKAHLWWTLIQKEGTNTLHCFNTRLCISCNLAQWLGTSQKRAAMGKW